MVESPVWFKVAVIFIAVAVIILVLIGVYMVWLGATARVSAQFDCEFDRIDYVPMEGEGTCVFPLISNTARNVTTCALPRDMHCRGTLQDFPIVRAIAELG